jgi:hypothetical protein
MKISKSVEHIGFRRVWRGGAAGAEGRHSVQRARALARPRFSHACLWGLIAKVFLCLNRQSFHTGDA